MQAKDVTHSMAQAIAKRLLPPARLDQLVMRKIAFANNDTVTFQFETIQKEKHHTVLSLLFMGESCQARYQPDQADELIRTGKITDFIQRGVKAFTPALDMENLTTPLNQSTATHYSKQGNPTMLNVIKTIDLPFATILVVEPPKGPITEMAMLPHTTAIAADVKTGQYVPLFLNVEYNMQAVAQSDPGVMTDIANQALVTYINESENYVKSIMMSSPRQALTFNFRRWRNVAQEPYEVPASPPLAADLHKAGKTAPNRETELHLEITPTVVLNAGRGRPGFGPFAPRPQFEELRGTLTLLGEELPFGLYFQGEGLLKALGKQMSPDFLRDVIYTRFLSEFPMLDGRHGLCNLMFDDDAIARLG